VRARSGRRRVAAVTWLAIAAPLPYSVSRVLWAAGVPVGIERELLHELGSPGVGSLYILLLAALAETTALMMHVVVRPRAERVPAWIPGLGGRRVRPAVVVGALLVPIAILAWRAVLYLPWVLDGFEVPGHIRGMPHWSLWVHAGVVWVWATSLAAATVAYRRATRPRNAPVPAAIRATPPARTP
jgi:hypothetical protein